MRLSCGTIGKPAQSGPVAAGGDGEAGCGVGGQVAVDAAEDAGRLRAMGIATVSYMIDNPFGTRRDPGWRLYMKDIPHYDLHVVQRDENIAGLSGTRGAGCDQDPDGV